MSGWSVSHPSTPPADHFLGFKKPLPRVARLWSRDRGGCHRERRGIFVSISTIAPKRRASLVHGGEGVSRAEARSLAVGRKKWLRVVSATKGGCQATQVVVAANGRRTQTRYGHPAASRARDGF